MQKLYPTPYTLRLSENFCLPGCDAVWSARYVPTCLRNILSIEESLIWCTLLNAVMNCQVLIIPSISEQLFTRKTDSFLGLKSSIFWDITP
jgi:hypothetical protein